MMRALALALTAAGAAGAASRATAADFPFGSSAGGPVPTLAWTGFHAGVNAGYVFDHDTAFDIRDIAPSTSNGIAANEALARPRASFKVGDDGVTVGGQAGYDFQFGSVVAGIEADLAYTDIGKTQALPALYGPGSVRTGLEYLGTARARLGYAVGDLLFYGTGGFAYGEEFDKTIQGDPRGSYYFSRDADKDRIGYAAGGGVEFAIGTNSFLNFLHANGMSVKVEALHYDLGTHTFATISSNDATALQKVSTSGNLARLGINYRF